MHDIDKSNDNRGIPKPNANDQKSEYLAQGTNQAQNHGAVDVADGLKIKERQILAVQDGFEKAAFGFYGDAGKFGLKVAKDGFNATTASSDELIFNSEQNTFKIVDKGTISLTKPGGTSQVTTIYTHGLGYIPAVMVFYGDPSAIYQPGFFATFDNTTGAMQSMYDWYIDSTKITFRISTPTTGGAFGSNLSADFTYYILQETAN